MSSTEHSKIKSWNWDTTYKSVNEQLFRKMLPTKVDAPTLLVYNYELAAVMDLQDYSIDEAILHLSGNAIPDGIEPIAQAYAGHQFGHFNILGDGRAILLGEHVNDSNQRFDVQLKGAGRTPFSRNGDGRATTYAMLREYLISEAMNGLRIPTTRSLAVVATGEEVYREKPNEGAVLTRIASSHIRVGTFQYAARFLHKPELLEFTNYVIKRHYPSLLSEENPALALLRTVQEKQIDLVVEWMRVGFIHGVLNTDNVSIAGESIDFGPCAFINAYHPETVFSSIDRDGRYAYGNQPIITQWNIAKLASALLPIIHEDESEAIKMCEAIIYEFPDQYESKWQKMMAKKLGFADEKAGDKELIESLLKWMQDHGADYTNTFLNLTQPLSEFTGIFKEPAFLLFHQTWKERIKHLSFDTVQNLMQENNPNYIPRNHLVEEALTKAANNRDFTLLNELVLVLKSPYVKHVNASHFQDPPSDGDRGYQTFCGT